MTNSLESVDLVKEQFDLELGMKDAGVMRFRKMVQRMIEQKTQEDTTYGNKIIGHYITPVSKGIEQWLDAGRGKAGAHRVAQPYLELLEPRVTAMLGLKVICSQLMSDKARLSRTAVGIARMMEDEVKCEHLRHEDRLAYKQIIKHAKTKGQYQRQVDVVDFLMDKEDIAWTRWPDNVCVHIGMVVINIIQDCVKLVEFYDIFDGKKTITCMRPTADTDKWVREHVDFMRFMTPVLEPMVIKPKQWIAGELKGGYWSDHIPRRSFVKTRNKRYLEELKYADMPHVLKAANAAQNTPWRINKDVLQLITELKNTNSELGDIPRADHYEIPEKPEDIETNEEARKIYRGKARKVYEDNVQLTSKRLSFLQVYDVAVKYSEYEALYFPTQLDFRGRLYFQPHFNPQGPDWMKGLLEFSEQKPLGEFGLEWLKIHVANLFGVDKVSYADRVKWCDENEEMLRAIAANPYQHREWADADKPFQAYAAAMDLVRAVQAEDPSKYLSGIPIAFDGSCSGIQNLSLAFRDEVGGAAVNLIRSETPSDIYQLVADKAVEAIQWYLDNGTEDEKTYAEWWAYAGLTRKVVKRNCMTFPYGSKERGFSDQLLEDFLKPYEKEHGEQEVHIVKLANFLAKINFKAVKQTVLKAAEAMDWMQTAARVVAKQGRPVCWTTPLGLPVVQAYVKSKEVRVETSLAGKRKVLSVREELLKPDTRKAANSISPNIVHSLDACHLMLTVSNAVDAGINSFALVHDSFATHAGQSEEFYDIIRQSFVQLYEPDIFADLLEQFKEQVPEDKHGDFAPLPEKGNLNPEEILDSLYCFA